MAMDTGGADLLVGTPVPSTRLVRSLIARYQHYAFAEVDNVGGYAYATGADWSRITKNAMIACTDLARTLKDGALAITEWEHIEKMGVCWREKGRGTLVYDHIPENRNEAQAQWLSPHLRTIGLSIAAAIEDATLDEIAEVWWGATVPVAKGKGAPFWFPGSNKRAAFYLAAVVERCSTVDEIEDKLRTYAGARIEACLTSDVRYQSARKARTTYGVSSGQLVPVGERVLCKARRISALPFTWNWVLMPIAAVLKWARRRVDHEHDGTIARAVTLARTYRTVFATDLSTFDETISGETILAWITLVLEPVLRALARTGLLTPRHARLALEVVRRCNEIGSLAPSPNMDECARFVRTYGANKSGIRFTSDIATDVNRARMRAKAADLRLPVHTTNFGDDAVIATNTTSAVRTWFDADYDNHGFVETLAPDVSYLMRRIPADYGYFSRYVGASINREIRFEPENEIIAATGLRARHELLAGHPLQAWFLPTVANIGSDPLATAAALAQATPLGELMLTAAATTPRARTSSLEGMLRHATALVSSGRATPELVTAHTQLAKVILDRQTVQYRFALEEARGMTLDFALGMLSRQQTVGV